MQDNTEKSELIKGFWENKKYIEKFLIISDNIRYGRKYSVYKST